MFSVLPLANKSAAFRSAVQVPEVRSTNNHLHLLSTLQPLHPAPLSFHSRSLLRISYSSTSCHLVVKQRRRQRDAICRGEDCVSLSLALGTYGITILLPPRRVVASPRNLFVIWSLTSFILWSYVSGRMAFTSIARTYANVNRDAPKSYWDYGTLSIQSHENSCADGVDSLQITWGLVFCCVVWRLMVGILTIMRL